MWGTSRGRDAGIADSFPSEHPDPHADLLRGEFGFQLDDRVLPVLPDERVHLRDLHLEKVLEGLLHLVPRRLTTNEELEPVPVLQVLRRRSLEHVQCLLSHIRMNEDFVRLHGDQLRRTSRAPSLNIVSRPGSPPGASTSAFSPAGLTTSMPGRFPKSRRTLAGSFTTTSRLRGCRYRRLRIFPRPARPPVRSPTTERSASRPTGGQDRTVDVGSPGTR